MRLMAMNIGHAAHLKTGPSAANGTPSDRMLHLTLKKEANPTAR